MSASRNSCFNCARKPFKAFPTALKLKKLRPGKALHAVSQYAQQCRYAADYIGNHVEIFKYDIEKQVRYWDKKRQEALTLKNAIQTDEGKVFESEITHRETESAELCRQFFHTSKR